MPRKPLIPCKHPGCPNLVEPGTKYCAKHKPMHPEETNPERSKMYNSKWAKASKQYLQSHPLCVKCMAMDPPRYTEATVVDHIVPHRGDPKLFWDKNNWQALCKTCHDNKTFAEDSHPTYTY